MAEEVVYKGSLPLLCASEEISSLSVEPCEGETLLVTVFGIRKSEVLPETLDGKPFTSPAVLCARFIDEEYFQIRCKCTPCGNLYLLVFKSDAKEVEISISKTMKDMTFTRFGVTISYLAVFIFGTVFWRQSVWVMKSNFLDHTSLGDHKTTIRQYFATIGSCIMQEEPSEALKTSVFHL